jgi:hypothetical protein
MTLTEAMPPRLAAIRMARIPSIAPMNVARVREVEFGMSQHGYRNVDRKHGRNRLSNR